MDRLNRFLVDDLVDVLGLKHAAMSLMPKELNNLLKVCRIEVGKEMLIRVARNKSQVSVTINVR